MSRYALVSSRFGAGGLCTRHRVSPYALAAAGMQLESLPQGNYPMQLIGGGPASKPKFMEATVAMPEGRRSQAA